MILLLLNLLKIISNIRFFVFLAFPLLSGFFSFSQLDSNKIFYSWSVNNSTLSCDSTFVDTLIDNFHQYDPAIRKTINQTSLGSPGMAILSNIFSLREENEFLFINSYFPYSFNESNNIYFNTLRHFTNVTLVSNTNKQYSEQDINIIHTQNINRYFNAGFKYNLISAKGQLVNQNTVDNSLGFFMSFRKKNNSIFANYNYNKFKIQDNAGIINDSVFTYASVNTPLLNIPVNLENARYNFIYNNYKIILKHDFLTFQNDSLKHNENSWGNVSVNLQANRFRKLYFDEFGYFYSDSYNDTVTTYDSTQFNMYNADLRFVLNKTGKFPFFFSSSLAFLTEYHDYNTYQHKNNDITNGFEICFFNAGEYLKWNSSVEFLYGGDHEHDITALLDIEKKLPGKSESSIIFYAEFNRLNPYVTELMYYSNNFKWDTTFLMKETTEFKLHYLSRKYFLSAGINYQLLDNYIYFNELAMPEQNTSTFSVLTLNLSKTFNLKAFHFSNTIYYQKTDSDSPVNIPEICFNNTTFFDFRLVKKLLYFRLGFDIKYFTEFYADSFMPSTGVFYQQKQSKTGNYPFADFFTDIKFKRARFFLKFEHVNSDMTGRNYFSAYHYPMHVRMFKFGISWNFYD